MTTSANDTSACGRSLWVAGLSFVGLANVFGMSSIILSDVIDQECFILFATLQKNQSAKLFVFTHVLCQRVTVPFVNAIYTYIIG